MESNTVTRAVADFEISGPADPPDGDMYQSPAPPRLSLTGRTVVVHVLAPLPAPAFASLRISLEALHGVVSPHLAALVDAGYLPGEGAWYATEDHGRATLADDHDLPTVLTAVAGAARGAHALHEAGLTHDGISPGSIRTGAGSGILDLPVLRPETAIEGRVLAISDPPLLDTVDPAVARGERPTRASDLWALGATLHQAATGQLLHPDLTTDQAIVAIQRVMFEPVQLAYGLDAAVAATVASCVARDPADRPPSADALADHLETLAAGR